MKKILPVALLLVSPVVANVCCIPDDSFTSCCYALSPPVNGSECVVFGGRADFLYWRPSVEGNTFARSVDVIPSGTGDVSSIHYQDYDYEWRAGFRLGLDAILPCDTWTTSLDWTHFDHKESGSAASALPTESISLPYLYADNFFNFGTVSVNSSTVNATWHVKLDVLDFVLSREFYTGCSVTLRPWAGVRALFLQQKVNGSSAISVNFTGGGTDFSTLSTAGTTAALSSSFDGVGAVAGLSSTWTVVCDFGFYGDVSASLLYGRSKSNLNGSYSNALFLPPIPFRPIGINWEHNTNALKANLDAAFGVQWRHSFDSFISSMTLRAGWEGHIYFSQNTLPQIKSVVPGGPETINFDTQSYGDISFQGLVVSAAFSF